MLERTFMGIQYPKVVTEEAESASSNHCLETPSFPSVSVVSLGLVAFPITAKLRSGHGFLHSVHNVLQSGRMNFTVNQSLCTSVEMLLQKLDVQF